MNDGVVHVGDCIEVLRTFDANSVDAVVTDPPAGISFINAAWDSNKGGRAAWIAWLTERMRECYRVAKPGAHAVVWAMPRTSHWTMTAVEDAGWEVRDVVTHLFAQGFPKSKAALKPAAEFWVLAHKRGGRGTLNIDGSRIGTAGGTAGPSLGILGDGLNGAVPGLPVPGMGRWPANVVLSHTSDCREVGVRKVKTGATTLSRPKQYNASSFMVGDSPSLPGYGNGDGTETVPAWECSPDCAVRLLDEQSGVRASGDAHVLRRGGTTGRGMGYGSSAAGNVLDATYGDTGGASRFYFCAKASSAERLGGNRGRSEDEHPTVKPLALMRWLCTLITPPGGLILDPFLGSGSTAVAAAECGFRWVGIEQDLAYAEIAVQRIGLGARVA